MLRLTAHYICLCQLLGNTIPGNSEKAVRYKVLPYAANNNRYALCRPKTVTGD
jgi:hypothetical protein